MKKRTLLIILGNLTAFGPFITDFYLPCLPELKSYFSASPSIIQASLTAGMLGLAVGQLFIGPITDKYGRKKPLLWCLLFFTLSTIGCMFSTDIRMFIFFRLLQGFTGASGLVISKAIISDTFTARRLVKYFAILGTVQGIAPIAAPVMGGIAFSVTSWQGTFGVLAIWGIVLWLACRKLKESLQKKDRLKVPVWKSFQCYLPVIRNGKYIAMNLLLSFATAGLMAYISASSFVFQEHFGLTPLQYSIYFACNAIGLVLGSGIIMEMKDLQKAAMIGSIGLFLTSLLAALVLLQGWAFLLLEVALFLMLFSIGMLTPVTMTLALKSVEENRGMASALLGAIPYLLGGVVAPLTGIGNMIHSTTLLLTLCAIVCLSLWGWSRKWNYA